MELTDILPEEKWAAFEKELYDRYHINCTVYDRSGTGVTGKPNWCNRLCPQIKANPDSLAAICAPGNQNFMAQSKRTGRAVIGECDAGLLKIAVPIFSNGDFLGTAGGCGLLPEGGAVETFIVEKTTGLSEEEINALNAEVSTMSEAKAKEMAGYIERRLSEIMGNSEARLGGAEIETNTGREKIDDHKRLQAFVDQWVEDNLDVKSTFLFLGQALQEKADVKIEFHERPGISYSLRASHKNEADRPLFVMIDIIDDDPTQRWLSVCFYGDTISDPDEAGDLIPEGLLGADGFCFDLTDSDQPLVSYVHQRIQEAYAHACRHRLSNKEIAS